MEKGLRGGREGADRRELVKLEIYIFVFVKME